MPNNMARTPLPPRGLVFFPGDENPAVRRRRWIFVAVLVAAAVALTWPVYPLFSAASPLVLGLPLCFAWVVLWLGVVFTALLWLFLGEEASEEAGEETIGEVSEEASTHRESP